MVGFLKIQAVFVIFLTMLSNVQLAHGENGTPATSFDPVRRLADQSNIISKAVNPYNGEYETTPEQTQGMVNSSHIDNALDELDRAAASGSTCPGGCSTLPKKTLMACEKLRAGHPYRLEMLARYSSQSAPERNYSDREFETCNSAKMDTTTFARCKRDTADRDRLIKITKQTDLDQALQQMGKARSTEEIIDFTAKMGRLMERKIYDVERNKEMIGAEGGISGLQLLEALRTNGTAGVCRDMALFQSQMIEQMGKQQGLKGYVSAFATTGPNFHTTVLVEDTRHPGTSYVMNYGKTGKETDGSGTMARSQAHSIPNTGIKMRIFGSDGRMVNVSDSLLGAFLHEVVGAEADPTSRARIGAVRFQIGDDPCNTFTLATGQLEDGTRVSTLSYVLEAKTKTSTHRLTFALSSGQTPTQTENLDFQSLLVRYDGIKQLIRANGTRWGLTSDLQGVLEGYVTGVQGKLNRETSTQDMLGYLHSAQILEGLSRRDPTVIQAFLADPGSLSFGESSTTRGAAIDGDMQLILRNRFHMQIRNGTELEAYVNAYVEPGPVSVNTMGYDPRRYRAYLNLLRSGVKIHQDITNRIYFEALLEVTRQQPTTVLRSRATLGSDMWRVFYENTQAAPGQTPSIINPDSFMTHRIGVEVGGRDQQVRGEVYRRIIDGKKDDNVQVEYRQRIDWGR